MSENIIKFTDSETGEEIEFSVIEETRVNNVNYILVTEVEETPSDDDETAYILKDISAEEETEANYVIVEEDEEIEAISKIFAELLEDVDFV